MQPADPGKVPTILIAEDDASVRRLVVFIFESYGYKLLVAEDGIQALEMAAAYGERIDLLISDVEMPRMRGTELAHALLARRPELRVLLMSAYTRELAGAGYTFLPKPFLASALVSKVHDLLTLPPNHAAG